MTRSFAMRSTSATIGLTLLAILILVVALFATATPSATSAQAAASPAQGAGTEAGEQLDPPGERRWSPMGRDPSAEEELPGSRPEPIARPASPMTPGPQPTEAPPSQALLVALAPVYIDVWNAEERQYSVSGTTPDLLVASAKSSIPPDPNGNPRHTMAYAGPVVWQHVPSYTVDPVTGGCTMTGVASTVRYQATVPVWTSPASVPPELLAWWRQVLEHIREHEGEHIRIFVAYVNDLPSRVSGQPCGSWEGIVNAWTAEIEGAQAAFDAAEAAWELPRYAGPIGG